MKAWIIIGIVITGIVVLGFLGYLEPVIGINLQDAMFSG